MFFSELFLQTVNIIIIAKQPVFIQLKDYYCEATCINPIKRLSFL